MDEEILPLSCYGRQTLFRRRMGLSLELSSDSFYIRRQKPCWSHWGNCSDFARPTPGLVLGMPAGIQVDANCFSKAVQPYNACSIFHDVSVWSSPRATTCALQIT